MDKQRTLPTAPTIPQVTIQHSGELESVKRYITLGVALKILEHDIKVVEASNMKLPRLYKSLLRGLQDYVLLEIAALRKQLRKAGIQIYNECKDASGIRAEYVCRGYRHRFSLHWGFIRTEAERLIKQHLPR
ncbi:hypothetical protein EBB07_11065 [Paenibacillaceae bacterium]|nr:hypothetical protein EBB07_11065 [Paenibacillaceae bacterium]